MTLRLGNLTDEERTEVQRIALAHPWSGPCPPRPDVVHARGGLKAEEIASRMDLCGNTVRYWINRFTERGLDALEEDVRTGRPPTSACCTEGFCQISGQLAESATSG
jgi:hypothetical protein